MPTPTIEHDEYIRIVAMSPERAKELFSRTDEPTDLGPADPSRYREGARVYGFRGSVAGCECATCVRHRASLPAE